MEDLHIQLQSSALSDMPLTESNNNNTENNNSYNNNNLMSFKGASCVTQKSSFKSGTVLSIRGKSSSKFGLEGRSVTSLEDMASRDHPAGVTVTHVTRQDPVREEGKTGEEGRQQRVRGKMCGILMLQYFKTVQSPLFSLKLSVRDK